MSTEPKIPIKPVNYPTLAQMLSLWVPLAASVVMMVLEPSIINMGLGRTLRPTLALAAYGVASSLAMLVEAPIMMLLDASVARANSPESFATIRRFTVGLSLLVLATGLIVSLTPLYDLIVVGLMNIPVDVAAVGRPTLQILSFWPVPIAWRRAHQGVLIRAGRTNIISLATIVRLATLAGSLLLGLLLFPGRGAIVSAMSMNISVTIEAIVITVATRRTLHSTSTLAASDEDTEVLTTSALWEFYRPLAVTTILRQLTRPMLSTGIAAALMGRESLAAWPVTWGLAVLIAGPAWSLQQLTTALARDIPSYRRVGRFSLSLSAAFCLILGIVAFSPLYSPAMGGIYNLSQTLQELARPGLQILAVYPLIMGAQSLVRGRLIFLGRTKTVRGAMLANVMAVGGMLVVGASLLHATGVVVAALAVTVGGIVELVVLLRHNS